MANQEHLDLLKKGVEVWNQWRKEQPVTVLPDLSGADLVEARLGGANLRVVNLSRANLTTADLRKADLHGAKLNRADLHFAFLLEADFYIAILSDADLSGATLDLANLNKADLSGANLSGADLSYADLSDANLSRTNLSGANLTEANLTMATVNRTIFSNLDLRTVHGLEYVKPEGPSTIGIDTIIRSQGKIPEVFLRRAGIPDSLVEQIPVLIGSLQPIEYYTCFISSSSKNEDFVKRLYADLQAVGVRCWFAPEDLKIGDRIRPRIDESIRIYDKLLLVLSEHSVASKWVEFEVEAAMDKEQEGKPPVLFPVRLDNTVMESTSAWAAHIRRTRNIGDFTEWKNHDAYQKAFARLLHDLRASARQYK